MIHKTLLIIYLSFFTNFIFAQVRYSFGIGAFTNFYENTTENTDIEFNNYYVLPHINFQLSTPITANNRLRLYGQTNFLAKQTRYELHKNISDGSVIREGYYNLYWSGELCLGLTYDIPIKNVILTPKIGGFTAWNYFGGVSMSHKVQDYDNGYFTHTSYGMSVSSQTKLKGTLTSYSGVNFGLSLSKITERGRTIGLFTDTAIPLQSMFRQPIQYNLNGRDFSFQGRFTYVNIGIQFGINRE